MLKLLSNKYLTVSPGNYSEYEGHSMNTKLFAIKIPENEKNAMDYVSNITNKTMSKLFYKPIQDAIYTNLGLILLYKIDFRNTMKISNMNEDVFNKRSLSGHTLPIIEDFISLIIDKNLKKGFWNIFTDIQLNEKDFLLHDIDLAEVAHNIGKEYIFRHGNLNDLDLNLARNIFFHYMLMTYFNITALGSINRLNLEWNNHKPSIKQFKNQLIIKYLTKYQPKKFEAIKVDEILEVSEYLD